MYNFAAKIVSYFEAATDIQAIRQSVFQVEQGVDSALDFDGLDEAAEHIVVYLDQQPIGTARMRHLSNCLVKIERVAVLAAYRGQGVGKQIMQIAIQFLDQNNIAVSKVHAQIQAAPFYEKFGFLPQGEAFYEADILHISMKRQHPNLNNLQ